MELEEYLQNNNVTLWRNNRALGPQQTKSLADFDYAEGLENITGKMVWICDYRANADPTKKPIRGIEPTPVVVTDAKETNKTIYYSPIYFRPLTHSHPLRSGILALCNKRWLEVFLRNRVEFTAVFELTLDLLNYGLSPFVQQFQ